MHAMLAKNSYCTICAINFLDAATLGGACDVDRAYPVGLQGHLPRGLRFACDNFFLFKNFLMISRSIRISGSTGTIFTIFSPNGRHLFVDDRSKPLFPIPQGTLPWQPILGKIVKITFFRQADIPKRL